MAPHAGCRSAHLPLGAPALRRTTSTAIRDSVRRTAAAVSLLVALTACGAEPAESGASSRSPAVAGEVTVLAAASLTTPLTSLAEAYELANPGTTVEVSFGSSTTLARQISQGADADLFLSAGTGALEQLDDVIPTATATIARNTLEIATPPDDPADIAELADLARPGVEVVLCAETVPCGKAADEVLARAGVEAEVVSREVDVTATLAKVTLGEADAAVVYHSDVVSARGAVRGVTIPAAQNTTLEYPVVRFDESTAAAAFTAYLAGPEGRRVLGDAGFLPP
ncbi:MAG: molybdate ABC transporter substrate-binding protein [Phycicoccus sp.]